MTANGRWDLIRRLKVKIVIHAFVFYVINLLTTFALLTIVNRFILCCEFAQLNGRSS